VAQNTGVYASANNRAIIGIADGATGVYGEAPSMGVRGSAENYGGFFIGNGDNAAATLAGMYAEGANAGAVGQAIGVYGYAGGLNATGVYGKAGGAGGKAVVGEVGIGTAVYASVSAIQAVNATVQNGTAVYATADLGIAVDAFGVTAVRARGAKCWSGSGVHDFVFDGPFVAAVGAEHTYMSCHIGGDANLYLLKIYSTA